MAGYDNIKNKGFDKRTTGEQREIAKIGGKASGVSRRKKADFNKTLNMLLTAEIDSPEWKPLLDSLGVDSTLESAMLMAQIKKALTGNTTAAYFVAEYAGQSNKTDNEETQESSKTEYIKAKTITIKAKGIDPEIEQDDDGFLEALGSTAAEDWTDD